MKPLVAVDADVLGRRRTGDETYVAALLRELAPIADEERIVAITRRPELVPDGIEAYELPARSQVARMVFGLPRALRRLRPALGHFIYVVPPAYRGPAVAHRPGSLVRVGPRPDEPARPIHVPNVRAPIGKEGRSRGRHLRAHETRPRRALRDSRAQDRRYPSRGRPDLPAERGDSGRAAVRALRGRDPASQGPSDRDRGARARRRRPPARARRRREARR